MATPEGCGRAVDRDVAPKLLSTGGDVRATRLVYDVGMTGLLGFSSGYRAIEHCGALVLLGTDFPYRQFYPPVAVPVESRRSLKRVRRQP